MDNLKDWKRRLKLHDIRAKKNTIQDFEDVTIDANKKS
jgi:hypothetical protein